MSFPPNDTIGPKWLKKATFYEPKRLRTVLEEIALDGAVGLAIRGAAMEAIESIDGKKRAASVRKKLTEMRDEDSKALSAKPKKKESKKRP